ncbi:MAG: dUTP diphosphatase [Vampirovibrionales bacterium]
MTVTLTSLEPCTLQGCVSVGLFALPHAPEHPPAYQTDWSAGMDLQAALEAPITLQPLERTLIPTGWVIALPEGYEAQIRPRSGLSIKHGITLVNCVGTVDADYRQEVKVPLVNLSSEPFTVEPGMRIAQMIVAPVTKFAWQPLAEAPLAVTSRQGGFGSTGI